MRFLRAHYSAKNHCSTATKLAAGVGYKRHGGVNLRYGILAARIAAQVGIAIRPPIPYLSLLVEFKRQKGVNRKLDLVMRREFAEGLKRAGWV